MQYNKPPKSYQEQIDLLKSRGLNISDEAFAIQILKTINYYRLSAYYLPFQKEKDIFNEGTYFADIFELYKFDKYLRILLLDAIENIEVTIRTNIAYYLAHKYGAFGYTSPDNFAGNFGHQVWMDKFKENSIERTHEIFVKSYFENYDEEDHVPIWMVTEITSFGQLSIFYKYLKNKDSQEIARGNYGIDRRVLTSWLHTLVYVRNLCAHHSRVWNRILSIEPMIPRNMDNWQDVSNKKLFCVFLIIKSLMLMPGKWDKWIKKFNRLLERFPKVEIKYMGFPENWKDKLIDF